MKLSSKTWRGICGLKLPLNTVESEVVRLKLFNPIGAATWLITSADAIVGDKVIPLSECQVIKNHLVEKSTMQPVEDVQAFGLCDLGMGFPELGYVSLRELAELRSMLPIERDLYFGQRNLSEVTK